MRLTASVSKRATKWLLPLRAHVSGRVGAHLQHERLVGVVVADGQRVVAGRGVQVGGGEVGAAQLDLQLGLELGQDVEVLLHVLRARGGAMGRAGEWDAGTGPSCAKAREVRTPQLGAHVSSSPADCYLLHRHCTWDQKDDALTVARTMSMSSRRRRTHLSRGIFFMKL